MSQIKPEFSPSPSPSPTGRAPRPTALLTNNLTHGLFNGGALDSQVTDSQYINDLTERNMATPVREGSHSPIHDTSFNSSGSSDTTYDQEEAYYRWQAAHSQGDEFEKPPGIQGKTSIPFPLDDPMDDSVPINVWPSRPSTPMFEVHYATLKPSEIQLSATEARIIAAIRSDRDAECRQWMEDEAHWRYDQCARIAALESLLEYHRIAFPPQ
ncbi:hypothetical protein B0H14DRAFT_3443904 [Mycena olivaceomarginata]|nr:hypothetical protein B0H14DRAFT_3443904 [Mycena olivaceomarginata]